MSFRKRSNKKSKNWRILK